VVSREGGGIKTGGGGRGIKGQIIVVVVINVDGDGGEVEGRGVEDGHQQRWTAFQLLLPWGEGGRE
jgi:hypothetical protein